MDIGNKMKDIDNEINKLINSESLSLDMCRNITYLTSAKKGVWRGFSKK